MSFLPSNGNPLKPRWTSPVSLLTCTAVNNLKMMNIFINLARNQSSCKFLINIDYHVHQRAIQLIFHTVNRQCELIRAACVTINPLLFSQYNATITFNQVIFPDHPLVPLLLSLFHLNKLSVSLSADTPSLPVSPGKINKVLLSYTVHYPHWLDSFLIK